MQILLRGCCRWRALCEGQSGVADENHVFVGLSAAALERIAPGMEVERLRLTPKKFRDGDFQIAARYDAARDRCPLRRRLDASNSTGAEERPAEFAIYHDGPSSGDFAENFRSLQKFFMDVKQRRVTFVVA